MERSQKNRFPVFRDRLMNLQGEMTISEFADFLGLTRQTVGFYLAGSRIPDILGLKRIAEKCNVSADWLIGMPDTMVSEVEAKVISNLAGMRENNASCTPYGECSPIGDLLQSRGFQELLCSIAQYKKKVENNNSSFSQRYDEIIDKDAPTEDLLQALETFKKYLYRVEQEEKFERFKIIEGFVRIIDLLYHPLSSSAFGEMADEDIDKLKAREDAEEVSECQEKTQEPPREPGV